MAKLYFEDFSVGAGRRIRRRACRLRRKSRRLPPSSIRSRCISTKRRARRPWLAGLCASGWHTCCLMMRIVADGFISELVVDGRARRRGNPLACAGAARRPPARAHDGVSETREPKSRPDFGFVRMKFEVLNAAGRASCSPTTSLMFGRRTPRASAATAIANAVDEVL